MVEFGRGRGGLGRVQQVAGLWHAKIIPWIRASGAWSQARSAPLTVAVTLGIGGISQAAGETGAAVTFLTAASDLSQQAEHLSGEVNTFLAGVRAA